MRVRITESQLQKIKLVENEQNIAFFMKKAEEIYEKVGRMYTKLTFATIAEILDGDVDLPVMEKKLDGYEDLLQQYNRSLNAFFDAMSDEAYEEKWEDKHSQIDDMYQKVTYHRIDKLRDVIYKLQELTMLEQDEDIRGHFKDVTSINI